MISFHKDKRDIESNGLRKLLSQTNISIIGDNLFIKSITQKRKKIKVETKRREKFLINNQEHLKKKQDSHLQFKVSLYYRNRCIRLHHENSTFTRKRIINIYIKNHELDRIKL